MSPKDLSAARRKFERKREAIKWQRAFNEKARTDPSARAKRAWETRRINAAKYNTGEADE